jgi:hypothetical protein
VTSARALPRGFEGHFKVTKATEKSALPLGAANVGGVSVVTIPLAEYEELLKIRRLQGETEATASVPLFRRPWWENDPEVADFVRTIFGKMPIGDMPATVASRFLRRAPSKSGIFRYMNVLRGRPTETPKKKRRTATMRRKPLPRAKFPPACG